MQALGVDPQSFDRSDLRDLTLPAAFARYKVIVNALKTFKDMKSNGAWRDLGFSKMTDTGAMELFVGKTLFYTWAKYFTQANGYPAMILWLEDNPDKPSDLNLWGVSKASYTMTNLKTWLENNGTLVQDLEADEEKEKEKKKKGKGKEKRSESRSPSKKDKHRKSSSSSKR